MLTDRFNAVATSHSVRGTRRRLLALLTSLPVAAALTTLDDHNSEAKGGGHKHHRHSGHRKRKRKKHRRVPSLVTLRVLFTGSQLIPSGTQTAVQFNQIDYDTRPSSFDLATSRFTAPYSGNYTVNVMVAWRGNAIGRPQVLLMKNGTTVVASAEGIPSGKSTLAALNTAVVLRPGDTLTVFGLQDSGAPVEIFSVVLSAVLVKRKSLAA
jgi:C1q domain